MANNIAVVIFEEYLSRSNRGQYYVGLINVDNDLKPEDIFTTLYKQNAQTFLKESDAKITASEILAERKDLCDFGIVRAGWPKGHFLHLEKENIHV